MSGKATKLLNTTSPDLPFVDRGSPGSRLEYVERVTRKDVLADSYEQMDSMRTKREIIQFELNNEMNIITSLLKDPYHAGAVNLRRAVNHLPHQIGVKPSILSNLN